MQCDGCASRDMVKVLGSLVKGIANCLTEWR